MKQRPIKFRAWDKQAKKWVSRQYTEVNGLGDVYFNDYPTKRTFCEDRLDIELSQYTGLHDKNGKEIYEGDIVEIRHIDTGRRYYGEVRYSEEAAFEIDFGGQQDLLLEYRTDDIEVIGNRYENPELLDQK